MAGTAAGPDDDDRQWQAYNDYLARLNGEHGSPAGSAR
jgi:hypothetical protein